MEFFKVCILPLLIAVAFTVPALVVLNAAGFFDGLPLWQGALTGLVLAATGLVIGHAVAWRLA